MPAAHINARKWLIKFSVNFDVGSNWVKFPYIIYRGVVGYCKFNKFPLYIAISPKVNVEKLFSCAILQTSLTICCFTAQRKWLHSQS